MPCSVVVIADLLDLHLPAARRGRALEAARDAGARADPGGQGARARASARRCASGAARIAAAAARRRRSSPRPTRRCSAPIYRDGGFARTRGLIARHFKADIDRGGIAGGARLEDDPAGAHPGGAADRARVPRERRERPGARARASLSRYGSPGRAWPSGYGPSKRTAMSRTRRAPRLDEEGDG